jgi:phospholipid-binding lipoprotein MlaA
MKTIYSISILSIFCLVVIADPCLAEDFKSLPIEVSPSPLDEIISAEVAMTSPEPSLSGESMDTIVPPLESLASFYPIEDSVSVPEDEGPIQTALSNIPPEPLSSEEPVETIADPLEPVNRAFFKFNDKFYFWILKPVATGYKTVVPQGVRVSVRNFFSNVSTPIRLVNCLLQAKFKCGGTETIRFLLNTTIGIAGFFDPAKTEFHIEKREKDFGTTLGFWGIGPAFYINWPILGPSSLRDTVGYVGDLFLDPENYLITSIPINLAVKSYHQVNETSLTLGEYEDLKEAALDPYIALKDAYHQYRQNKIKGK